MGQKRPPFEYLVASSKNSLEAFELARLNHASNLRKALRQIVDEWVDAEVDGKIARWILECRREENLGTDLVCPFSNRASSASEPRASISSPILMHRSLLITSKAAMVFLAMIRCLASAINNR